MENCTCYTCGMRRLGLDTGAGHLNRERLDIDVFESGKEKYILQPNTKYTLRLGMNEIDDRGYRQYRYLIKSVGYSIYPKANFVGDVVEFEYDSKIFKEYEEVKRISPVITFRFEDENKIDFVNSISTSPVSILSIMPSQFSKIKFLLYSSVPQPEGSGRQSLLEPRGSEKKWSVTYN